MATTPHQAGTTAPTGHHAAHDTGHGAAGHVHGTMEVRDHERTFEGFVRIAMWSAIASLAVLVFLALTNA